MDDPPPDEQRVIARLTKALDNVLRPLHEIEPNAYTAIAMKPELQSELEYALREVERSVLERTGLLDDANQYLNREPEEFVRRGRARAESFAERQEAADRLRREHFDRMIAHEFKEAGYDLSVGDKVRMKDGEHSGFIEHLIPKEDSHDHDLAVIVLWTDDHQRRQVHPSGVVKVVESDPDEDHTEQFAPGAKVVHKEFGFGVVIDIEAPGADYDYEGVWVKFDIEPPRRRGLVGKDRFVRIDELVKIADSAEDLDAKVFGEADARAAKGGRFPPGGPRRVRPARGRSDG